MMNKIGIYPGTFDPMTAGHMDIIKRSLRIVDNLVIAVANNINKHSLFNVKAVSYTHLTLPTRLPV